MYIPLLFVARGHPPPHCENTQVLREAFTEDMMTKRPNGSNEKHANSHLPEVLFQDG